MVVADVSEADAARSPWRGRWEALDRKGMRVFWLVAGAVLAAQLAVLVAYSAYLYHRFDLTDDFAAYHQAWWSIGHGHLNPVDTIHVPTFPFWQNHFELAMWPIAWVGRLWPDPVQLLWLQDLALVATEALTLWWVAGLCAERLARRRNEVAIAALVALVVNVWWYETASFDVHFETIGLPFAVWCGLALWRGRTRQAWLGAVLAVLFGDVVSLSILFVAVAGMASRRVRRAGHLGAALGIAAFAVAWLALVTVLDANQGSGIVTNYGYLVGAAPGASAASVAGALLLHPWHALRVLVGRWHGIGRVLLSAGLLGVVTPWGGAMAVGTLAPTALNVNPAFLSPDIAFQTLAVIPFVFVGSVMVLLWIGRRRGWWAAGAWALAAGLLAASLVQNAPLFTGLRAGWWRVDAPAAATLRRALPQVPGSAQVIASQGVIGRFAGRRYVYPYLASPQAFPVNAPTVVFVVAATAGIEPVPAVVAAGAVAYVQRRLGGALIAQGAGVVVLEWHPRPSVRAVVLTPPQ